MEDKGLGPRAGHPPAIPSPSRQVIHNQHTTRVCVFGGRTVRKGCVIGPEGVKLGVLYLKAPVLVTFEAPLWLEHAIKSMWTVRSGVLPFVTYRTFGRVTALIRAAILQRVSANAQARDWWWLVRVVVRPVVRR